MNQADAIARALGDPRKRAALQTALLIEADHANDATYLGWAWHEVGITPIRLMHMIGDHLVRIEYQSNRYTFYRLNDPDAIRAALDEDAAADEPDDAPPPEPPAELFEQIEGQQRTKDLFRRALAATRPVHVLMTGPPGTSKSLFLEDLAALPDARYILGDTSSRAGILDFLFTERCRYLIIDELDKADVKDLSILLTLMERGRITSMKRGNTQEAQRTVWVFAGCNRDDRLPAPLLSRFVRVNVPAYTADEFRAVVESVLVKREGASQEMARFVAHELLGRTYDVRDAIKVVRLATSTGDAGRVIRELWP